jgi:hypothetical protein
MLSGRPPRWPDTGAPSLATMIRLHEEPLPDLPGVPMAITNVLRQGLAADPAHRYGSAAEFRDALRAASPDDVTVITPSSGPPAGWTPAGFPQAAAPPPHNPAPTAYQQPPPYQPARPEPYNGAPPISPAPTGQQWQRPGQPPPYVPAYTPAGYPQRPAGGYPPVRPPAPPVKSGGGRGWLIAALIVVLSLIALAVTMAAYALAPDDPNQARTTATPSPRPSASSQAVDVPIVPSLPSGTDDLSDGLFGDCPLQTVASSGGVTARCPSEPECYAGINNIGGNVSAAKRDCKQEHSWETFLIGELPASIKSADYDEVWGNAVIKVLCGPQAVSIALDGESTSGWSSDVLPPTEAQFAAGKREFRCVAGKGLDKLDKPYFATY